jgi:hypothetical protein
MQFYVHRYVLRVLAFKQLGDIWSTSTRTYSCGIRYCITMCSVPKFFRQIIGLNFKVPSVKPLNMKTLCCLKESRTDNPVTRRHVPEIRGLQLSIFEKVELAALRLTACTDISVTVLWLSTPHFCLNHFPTVHALSDKHSSFSLDTHWSRSNEKYVFLFCFRMVINTLGNRKYKPLVSILKSTATKSLETAQ